MACESMKGKLDTYLDGELPEQEMRTLDSHVRSCASCSSDALEKLQMKRAIQVAGKRFTPSAEFRKRIEQTVASKPRRSFGFGNLRQSWILAVAAVWPLSPSHCLLQGTRATGPQDSTLSARSPTCMSERWPAPRPSM